MRGFVPAGKDDMGGTAANRLTNQTDGVDGLTLGATGGAEGHVLTEGQLAEHFHFSVGDGGNPLSPVNTTTPIKAQGSIQGAGDSEYELARGDAPATKGLTSGSGSDEAHNNVQPTIVLNYMVRYQ